VRELEADGWVSVEERLPEDDGNYIITWHRESMFSYYSVGTAMFFIEERGWSCEGDAVPDLRVTHWRPLPPPPGADE
jgi:hypothetical protein